MQKKRAVFHLFNLLETSLALFQNYTNWNVASIFGLTNDGRTKKKFYKKVIGSKLILFTYFNIFIRTLLYEISCQLCIEKLEGKYSFFKCGITTDARNVSKVSFAYFNKYTRQVDGDRYLGKLYFWFFTKLSGSETVCFKSSTDCRIKEYSRRVRQK